MMAYCRLPPAIVMEAGLSPENVRVRRLDIRWVKPEQFPTALLYFTGSKEFNGRMRGIALKAGYTLNEYGLWKLPTAVAKETDHRKQHEMIRAASRDERNLVHGLKSEQDVFDKIGMSYVEPRDRKE